MPSRFIMDEVPGFPCTAGRMYDMIFFKIRLAVRLGFRVKFSKILLVQILYCDKLVKVLHQN